MQYHFFGKRTNERYVILHDINVTYFCNASFGCRFNINKCNVPLVYHLLKARKLSIFHCLPIKHSGFNKIKPLI